MIRKHIRKKNRREAEKRKKKKGKGKGEISQGKRRKKGDFRAKSEK